ncbi:MAG: SDR family NAD(P)-dependent oxidoreductase [Pyrinomonadaceae bacterium]
MATVLVTGTSKGIGMATALVLGRAGHTVYATMRDPRAAPELAQTAAKEGLPIHVSINGCGLRCVRHRGDQRD